MVNLVLYHEMDKSTKRCSSHEEKLSLILPRTIFLRKKNNWLEIKFVQGEIKIIDES